MSKTLDFKNFGLERIAINSKNLITVDWYDLTKRNDLLSVESDSLPSEELILSIAKFNKPMAISLDLTKGFEFAREHNRKNEEALKLAVHGCIDEYERCQVKAITFVGSNEYEGIKIKGNLICDGGTVAISSTPLIKFNDDEMDEEFRTELNEICEELKKQVYPFIYLGKRATNLFDSDESGLNNSGKVLKAV